MSLGVTKGHFYVLKSTFPLKFFVCLKFDPMKVCFIENIINTHFFQNMKFDLKGHIIIRSHKALLKIRFFKYLFCLTFNLTKTIYEY